MQFMPLSIPFPLLHTKSLFKKKKHHILETFTNFNTKSYKPQNRKLTKSPQPTNMKSCSRI